MFCRVANYSHMITFEKNFIKKNLKANSTIKDVRITTVCK